jgi:hypothetical protein
MRPFLILLLIAVFCGFGAGTVRAGERMRVALFFAENGSPPPNARLAEDDLHEQLREVFGFRHYELKKAQMIELHHEWEQWFVPRQDFFLRIVPLPHEPGERRRVAYEIYKDGFIVAKGEYEPHEDTPLFINGPNFRDGRLIFVLQARD